MKKCKLLILAVLVMLPAAMLAETRASRDTLKHELRIGWGDQLFESMVWRKQMPGQLNREGTLFYRNESYRYTQHLFLEYQYRFTHWFSLGATVDGSAVLWNTNIYDLNGNYQAFDSKHNFYNLVIMPNVRFTYLYNEYVSLHSAIGIGLNVNGGTDVDIYGKRTAFAGALDLTYIGVTVGHGHWYGSFEIGGLFSMKNGSTVYMASSKILRASVGCRF